MGVQFIEDVNVETLIFSKYENVFFLCLVFSGSGDAFQCCNFEKSKYME